MRILFSSKAFVKLLLWLFNFVYSWANIKRLPYKCHKYISKVATCEKILNSTAKAGNLMFVFILFIS